MTSYFCNRYQINAYLINILVRNNSVGAIGTDVWSGPSRCGLVDYLIFYKYVFYYYVYCSILMYDLYCIDCIDRSVELTWGQYGE